MELDHVVPDFHCLMSLWWQICPTALHGALDTFYYWHRLTKTEKTRPEFTW